MVINIEIAHRQIREVLALFEECNRKENIFTLKKGEFQNTFRPSRTNQRILKELSRTYPMPEMKIWRRERMQAYAEGVKIGSSLYLEKLEESKNEPRHCNRQACFICLRRDSLLEEQKNNAHSALSMATKFLEENPNSGYEVIVGQGPLKEVEEGINALTVD